MQAVTETTGKSMTSSEDQPRPKHLEPSQISAIAEAHFGQRVIKITAPGGRNRDSVRVHFQDRTVIASYRHRDTRRNREVAVLQALNTLNAPVPQFLGQHDGVLFQSDAGAGRLSSEMSRQDAAGQRRLARAAFDSLWQIKQAARQTGLVQDMPSVASTAKWAARFGTGPRALSITLDMTPPLVDWAKLSKAASSVPRHFVKWDSRSGNAAVQADGSVIWFDWEHAGRRHGVEDFAFLIGDEFWPLDAVTSLEVFAESCPGDAAALVPYLRRFSTLQIVERLRLIKAEVDRRGWTEYARAQRYDRMGATPQQVVRLAEHGQELSELDEMLHPLGDWFSMVAAKMTSAATKGD